MNYIVCISMLLICNSFANKMVAKSKFSINNAATDKIITRCTKDILQYYIDYRMMIFIESDQIGQEIIKNIAISGAYYSITQNDFETLDGPIIEDTEFIVIISNSYELKLRIAYITQCDFKSTAMILIVLYEEQSLNIFNAVLLRKVIAVDIVGNIYRVQPFTAKNNYIEIGILSNCSRIDAQIIADNYKYNYKLLVYVRLSYGPTVDVYGNYRSQFKPFAIGGLNDKYVGVDVAFVNEVAYRLNLKLVWSDKLDPHILLGDNEYHDDTSTQSEPQQPYYFYDMVFIVPLPNQLPHWVGLYAAFKAKFWLIIGLTFVITTALFYALSLLTRNPEVYQYGQIAVLNLFGLFIAQSIEQPKRWLSRFIYISWVIYSLIIVAAYTGLFYSYLIEPMYEKPIETIQDVIESDLKMWFELYPKHQLDYQMFNEYQYNYTTLTAMGRIKYFSKRADLNNFRKFIKRRIIDERDSVYYAASYEAEYQLRKLKDTSGVKEFNIIKFKSQFGCLKYARNFVLTSMVNHYVQRATESGLFRKWEDNLKQPHFKTTASEPAPLTMTHIWAMFFILFVGLTFAINTFVIEIILFQIF